MLRFFRCFTNTPWFLVARRSFPPLHVVPSPRLSGNWSWWVKMFANVGIVIFIVVVPSSPTTSVELNIHPRCEDAFRKIMVRDPPPKKLRCWKRGHAKMEMCILKNHQFSGDVQYVNWGGFGWKVSRKSSYPSPKFNGWSRWNLCRSNMFKNPTFVGPSRATKKVRISQRNPFLSRWFKPFFLCGKCMLLPRENRIHTKYTSWMSRCVWMIYIYDIYCIYLYIYIHIHHSYIPKMNDFGKMCFLFQAIFLGGDRHGTANPRWSPTSPCSVPSRRTWTIGSWKTAVTGWFCVFVCCFVGEKNQWMSWMSRFWAALAKSPLVAEKEKRWFCGTTVFLLCLTGTFIRTRLWSHITV